MSQNAELRMIEEATGDADCQQHIMISFERATVRKNVIEGVHLVGFQAKNRRSTELAPYKYKESALRTAAPLYDNADVYMSHGKGTDERPIESKIGFVSNSKFKEGVGVVGDLVLNEKHPFFEAIIWWAENKPSKLGMSHVATNLYNSKENAVVEVRKVHSVDIVSSPSTTDGLFKEGVVDDKLNERRLEAVLDAAWSLISDVQWPLQGNKLPMVDRAVKVLPVVKDLIAELNKIITPSTTTKESDMELKDLTIDKLKSERSDLVAAITKEAITVHTATEAKIAESVKDIPEKLKTTLFMTQVRESINDDTKLQALIADRKSLVTTETKEAVKPDTQEVTQVESAPPARTIPTTTPAKKLDRNEVVAAAKRK